MTNTKVGYQRRAPCCGYPGTVRTCARSPASRIPYNVWKRCCGKSKVFPPATHVVHSTACPQTIIMSMDSTSSTLTLLDIEKVERAPLPPPLEGLQPHSEFWIEDGNLILVARDVAFRVYRGLLAKQSTVLGEMAAKSSEDVYEAIFDGCPIVRLSDSPQDLTHLLRILLPKSHRRQVH